MRTKYTNGIEEEKITKEGELHMNQSLAVLNELKTTFNQKIYSIKHSYTLLHTRNSAAGIFETIDLRDYKINIFKCRDCFNSFFYAKNEQFDIYTEALAALLHRFFWEYNDSYSWPYKPEKVIVAAKEYIYAINGNKFKLDIELIEYIKSILNEHIHEVSGQDLKFFNNFINTAEITPILIDYSPINKFLFQRFFLAEKVYYYVTEEYSCLYLRCNELIRRHSYE